MAVQTRLGREMGGKEHVDDKEKGGDTGDATEQDGGGMVAEVEAEQAMKSEMLMKSYKRWKILIISVIVFVMLFILAFLLKFLKLWEISFLKSN